MPKQLKTMDDMFFGAATVGARGQIVVPIEARKQCGIEPNDKVLVFSHPPTNGFIVCKADALERVVREIKSAIRSTKGNAKTKKKSRSTKRKES